MTPFTACNQTFCYDGSLEGFLSAVFDAYAYHVIPFAIEAAGNVQLALGIQVLDVKTDASHAERVRIGICNRAGHEAYQKVKKAFLASEEGRELVIFKYIMQCMACGRQVLNALDDAVVAEVERLARRVANEQEDMYQFVRFEQLETGLFYAVINPRNNVLPLIMGHFCARFNTQPFVIYDEAHKIAGVYDKRRQYLVPSPELNVPASSPDEQLYQQLWKTFYDSLSNEQRYNPDLRRNFMPKRFWRNLTEMKLAIS